MADARRYRNKQNGHIVGPLTATDAKGALAGLSDGEWEVEGDTPGQFGEKAAAKASSTPRKRARKPAAEPAPAPDPAPAGDNNQS